MSDLTQEQLDHFRSRLERLRDDVTGRLHTGEESAKPVDLNEPIGRLGRMDALQVQQIAKTQRRRDETLLQLIKSALARIRAGTFGDCLKCEEPIDLQRLEVSPEATLCVACRRQSEAH